MALSILQMVLPVLLVIALGFLCNRRQWLSAAGLQGIKSVVGKITLPVVLFNAFFTADYSGTTALTFCVVYISLGAALLIGFWARRSMRATANSCPF